MRCRSERLLKEMDKKGKLFEKIMRLTNFHFPQVSCLHEKDGKLRYYVAMYLKSLKIENYRKFSCNRNNEIFFVEGYSADGKDTGIAQNTTLLVGKNNSGKTSIVHLLEKLASTSPSFSASDFSFEYLDDWLKSFKVQPSESIELPFIRVTINIMLEPDKNDYIQNLRHFIPIASNTNDVAIILKYAVKDEQESRDELKQNIVSIGIDDFNVFNLIDFLKECIDDNRFEAQILTKTGKRINNAKLSDLLSIDLLSAILIQKEGAVLAEQFSRILAHRFKKGGLQDQPKMEKAIKTFNDTISNSFGTSESERFNSLSQRLITSNVSVSITGDLGLDDIFSRQSNILQYSYSEGSSRKLVPEDQFGLGYSSLLMIIAKIMELVESDGRDDSNCSKVKLICIEEPETHLHPQMQEMFIRNISTAVGELLGNKKINFQLIITTHSPHILNSKLRDSGKFDSINVLTEDDYRKAKVIKLENEDVKGKGLADADFRFIQKHISLGMSDMFFADALVLVEGDSEYKLLPFLVQNHPAYEALRHHYISFVSVGGAHGHVYRNILEKIGIPTAIITDLDIKKADETDDMTENPVKDLSSRTTTNPTLIKFLGNDSLESAQKSLLSEDCNIGVFTQNKIQGIYPSSFEGALFLANIENDVIKSLLGKMFKRLANEENSMEAEKVEIWQERLSMRKGEFSSELLYKLMTDDNKLKAFVVPGYIDTAFRFLKEKLDSRIEEK